MPDSLIRDMKNELLKPALIELRAALELPDIAYDKSIIKKDGHVWIQQ